MTASTAALAKNHGRGATGSPSERFTSRDPEAFETPSGRDELWRFTPLSALRPLFEPFTATGSLSATVDRADGRRPTAPCR